MKKVLVLSKQSSSFCVAIQDAIVAIGNVLYKSEHDFTKVSMLLDFVAANGVSHVLMPNPYGNNKRLVCYKKLNEVGIPVIASDRGALPNSWFFDFGFNFDSKSYSPKQWDIELNDGQIELVNKYIGALVKGDTALERQGKRFGGRALKERLGFCGKKVVFVPLQRPADTVIKFFSGAVGSVENFIEWVHLVEHAVNKESDWVFVLKKHPLEVDYFPTRSSNIRYVPDVTNFYDLIEMSDAVLLINSGVGLNALAFGKKVICTGDSFYAHDGLAFSAVSHEEVASLLQSNIYPNFSKVQRFFWHLIDKVYSFGDFKTELVKSGSVFRNETRSINFKKLKILGEDLKGKGAVLYVSPLVPVPIYRGNQARIDATLRWLIGAGFKVDLVVLNTSFGKKSSVALADEIKNSYVGISSVEVLKHPSFSNGLRKVAYFARVVWMQFSGGKNEVVNVSSCPDKLKRLIAAKINNTTYDFLYLNYIKTAGVVPVDYDGRVVLDTHDYQTAFLEEDQKINGKGFGVDVERFRKSEHTWLNKLDCVVAINRNEASLFKGIVSDNVEVYTVPAFFPNRVGCAPKFWRYEYDVIYVGSVSNFNVSGLQWFLDVVLPFLLLKIPDVRIAVVGNIARSKEINWGLYQNVEVLGMVSDLSGKYASAACCIAPILGGAGMKIKVVEALSYAKAIVATSKAVDGIDWQSDMSIAVEDDPKNFAERIVNLLQDDNLRLDMEERAARLYAKDHSEEAMSSALNAIFERSNL